MLAENIKALSEFKDTFSLSDDQLKKFTLFVELFEKKNQFVNLVSKNDVLKLVSRHLFESMQILELDKVNTAKRVMDLGSGGGFPGIPVAIMKPDVEVFLVESRKKKALFLQEAAEVSGLLNVTVLPERVEDVSTIDLEGPLDLVMARAVASLKQLWLWGSPLLKKDGCIITYKGGDIQNEKNELSDSSVIIEQITIPALAQKDQRYFIQLMNK